jgi:hypothetical protein
MQFTESAITEFITIYEDTFNESIAREEAIVMARRLVNMYRLFLRPLPGGVSAALVDRSTQKEEALEQSDLSESQAS